jgi:hypothetical protein
MMSLAKLFLQIHPSHHQSIRRIIPILVALAIGLIIISLFPSPYGVRGYKDYLPLHMMLETVAIVIAMQVAGLGWNAYSHKIPSNIVFLAAIFVGVAILDFSHMLSYEGMPDYVTPGSPDKGIDFWLAARLLSAIGLLIFSTFHLSTFRSITFRSLLITFIFILVGFIHWLVLFQHDLFPHIFFVTGSGLTALKTNTEYVIIAFCKSLERSFLLKATLFDCQ